MARVSRGRKGRSAGAAAMTEAEAQRAASTAVGREAGRRGNGAIAGAAEEAVFAPKMADLAPGGLAPAELVERREALAADRGDPATAEAHRLRAYIDEAGCNRITGWVWDPQQPQERIALELLDGDTRLAAVRANQFRADLRQAGIGDGRHAFIIPLGEGLLPGIRHVLHLRQVDTGAELPGSPVVIERPMTAAGPALHEAAASSYLPGSAADGLVADPGEEPAD